MINFSLSKEQTALLIVDVQDKIFNAVDHSHEVLKTLLRLIKSFQILQLPITITEQYPEGLGSTILPIKTALGPSYKPWQKTTFSCLDDPSFFEHIQNTPIKQWVVVGVEAHVCVLQTAKGLIRMGKQVVVLNDAISSRSVYDFSTAISEMKDMGIRVSSSETILFELLQDSKSPHFKDVSKIIKSRCEC